MPAFSACPAFVCRRVLVVGLWNEIRNLASFMQVLYFANFTQIPTALLADVITEARIRGN
jgi:hypothetical protein